MSGKAWTTLATMVAVTRRKSPKTATLVAENGDYTIQ